MIDTSSAEVSYLRDYFSTYGEQQIKMNNEVFTLLENTAYFVDHGIIKQENNLEKGGELRRVFVEGDILFPVHKKIKNCTYSPQTRSSILLGMNIDSYLQRNNLELNKALIGLLQKDNALVESHMNAIHDMDAPERIEYCIASLVKRYGKRVGFEILLKPSFTQKEIGSYSKTSRQFVTSTLGTLKRDGVISFDRSRILIKNPEYFGLSVYDFPSNLPK